MQRLNNIEAFQFDDRVPADKRFREFVSNISKSGIEAKKTKKAALKVRKKEFQRLREASKRRLGLSNSRARTPTPSDDASGSQASDEDHNAYIKKQAQLQHKDAV